MKKKDKKLSSSGKGIREKRIRGMNLATTLFY